LLESETYIGGHVECLDPGVFRADIPCKFKIVPAGAQQLIDDLDKILKFAITVEGVHFVFSHINAEVLIVTHVFIFKIFRWC
jgi:hypothetical protein